jgi:hypothetical protein
MLTIELIVFELLILDLEHLYGSLIPLECLLKWNECFLYYLFYDVAVKLVDPIDEFVRFLIKFLDLPLVK